MKNLSHYANSHPRTARLGIIFSSILIVSSGGIMGMINAVSPDSLPIWPALLLTASGLGLATLAPDFNNKFKWPSLKNTYGNRLLTRTAFISSSFFLAFAGGHSLTENYSELLFPNPVVVDGGGTSKHTPSKNLPEHRAEVAIYGAEAEAPASVETTKVKQVKKSSKHWTLFKKRPNISRIGKFLLFLLGTLASLALSLLAAALACSISCGSGSSIGAAVLGVISIGFLVLAAVLLVMGFIALFAKKSTNSNNSGDTGSLP